MPNGSRSPCTTEHGQLDRVELVLARLLGPAGSVQRERQAEHGDRTGLGRRPARHPRAGGATADHERQPAQLALAQLLDHRNPGLVQPIRAGAGERRPATQVRLLHEGDAEALAACATSVTATRSRAATPPPAP